MVLCKWFLLRLIHRLTLLWLRKPTGYISYRMVSCRIVILRVSGLFVPLHFRSRERKVHRENFRSRGTFVPWNIRSRGAKSPRTFVPWNFRTPGTFAPQERMFQELSLHGAFAPVESSLHKQLLCPLTFAFVEFPLPYFKKLWKAIAVNR